MRKVKAKIDSIPVTLHVAETEEEYREGARTLGGTLEVDEGILFDFSKNPQRLGMENSGVNQNLALLFFITIGRAGIVSEVGGLDKQDATPKYSKGVYGYVVELREDFCKANRIKQGSILTLDKGKL